MGSPLTPQNNQIFIIFINEGINIVWYSSWFLYWKPTFRWSLITVFKALNITLLHNITLNWYCDKRVQLLIEYLPRCIADWIGTEVQFWFNLLERNLKDRSLISVLSNFWNNLLKQYWNNHACVIKYIFVWIWFERAYTIG